MKRYVLLLIVGMFVTLISVSSAFALPVETRASNAYLIDLSTETVLLDKNSSTSMPTSSMSKLMTLYVIFDALKQGYVKTSDKFHVSEKAWKMKGSRMFLDVGSYVTVEDLVRGVAIQSGNDAAVALGEGFAGTEEAFVERLNLASKELGMNESHFMNASGMPHRNHYSTAKDLTLLARRIIKDFPEYYHYFGEKDFTYNKIYQPNRLPILGKINGADGLKTGHAEAAGYGLVGSAIRDGHRLILVVNGLKTDKERSRESSRLLEWGFRNFKVRELFEAGEEVAKAKVWLGDEDEVSLVSEEDLKLSLPIFKEKETKITLRYDEPIHAPIKKGDQIATLTIEVPDQKIREVSLIAGKDVERRGIIGRAIARLSYLIEGSL